MIVKNIFTAITPFIESYTHSDLLGKLIFLLLILLSITCWVVIIHKTWLTWCSRKESSEFQKFFHKNKSDLNIEYKNPPKNRYLNPFYDLYQVTKKHTIDILNKNHQFGMDEQAFLSTSDIEYVESHLMAAVATHTKHLERNIFILSTIVSLAPFLGLLGTVWGILITFSSLHTSSGMGANQMVLGGLSLALTTTVLGLVVAIPALIGYNYLKNVIRDFQTDMESFSNEILASVEFQYRKVELG